MTYIYRPWNLEEYLRQQRAHAASWKDERHMKKNRPLCGARCRDGHSCRAKAVVNKRDKVVNGRCRMHGGLSTGAKTAEGKEKCRQAARRGMLAYWKRVKESKKDGHDLRPKNPHTPKELCQI